MRMVDFGECPHCGGKLIPIWFTEEEMIVDEYGHMIKTGRKRRAISHLLCENCLRNQCIDDSFDGDWYY